MKTCLCMLSILYSFLFPVLSAGQNCNNWAYFSGVDPGVQIGDLDIPGDKITVEALFNRIDNYNPAFYGGDIVSKHTDPTDVNYLLRPTRAEITTTTGWHGTPDVCSFQKNKTYHLAMVYDGKTLKFYRNGFLMSQTPCTGNMVLNNWITRIGSTAAPSDINPTDFHGYINEVRIWNVARTQNELRTYMNKSLPNPSAQAGLLAYYTFDDLKNKQGNSQWDGTLLNNASINKTNPECELKTDSCESIETYVNASFTSPDTVCTNSSFQVTNTSIGATNYYWSFCSADLSTNPTATNLGTLNNQLNKPVFIDLVKDENENYFGFLINWQLGQLIRLKFGKSLLNTPVIENLGNLNNAIPPNSEGIQVIKNNGNWYAIIVSGGNSINNTSSVMLTANFGSSLSSNNPVVTNWGNIGKLNYPHDLYVFESGNNIYGYTINILDNSITRFNFGNDIKNKPTGVNLGNIGNLSYPCGFTFLNYNQIWYAFVANRNSNTISRLNFGSSLLNTPTGVNIGNPGAFFERPRDISMLQTCSGISGFVVNEENSTITKLNFGFDLTSIPSSKNLGNIGNLDFPHSISELFTEDNDIYAFIPNSNSNTLSRLKFSGCTDIPVSYKANPDPVIYVKPGVYNVNLLVDIGLPTQASFCKQIVVRD